VRVRNASGLGTGLGAGRAGGVAITFISSALFIAFILHLS